MTDALPEKLEWDSAGYVMNEPQTEVVAAFDHLGEGSHAIGAEMVRRYNQHLELAAVIHAILLEPREWAGDEWLGITIPSGIMRRADAIHALAAEPAPGQEEGA